MTGLAVVVEVGAKIASSYKVPSLDPIAGVAAIKRLVDRLTVGLAGATDVMVIGAGAGSEIVRLAQAVDGCSISVFASQAIGELELLLALSREYPWVGTFVVFPDDAIVPDCRVTRDVLRLHEQSGADATYVRRCAPGLLPRVISADAIRRLANEELPAEVQFDAVKLMELANSLAAAEPAFAFRVQAIEPTDLGIRTDLHPSTLLVNDPQVALAVAELTSTDLEGDVDDSMARHIKRRLFPPPPRPPVRRTVIRPWTVLYCSYALGLSGAEASWAALITGLDRNIIRPMVVLPCRSALSERLQDGGVTAEIPGCDLARISPGSLGYWRRLMVDRPVALVHVNGSAGWPLPIAAHEARVPIVIHARRLDMIDSQAELQFASRIIAISDVVRRDLLRCDIDPQLVRVIYNGVRVAALVPRPSDRAQMRRDNEIPPAAKVLCMIGRIDECKRQDLLLSILPSLLIREPDLIVAFVGETYPQQLPYLARLRRMVATSGVSAHVRFLGFQNDMPPVYAMSDAVVLCSEEEPFGRCIIEAMAADVPVIAPNRGGPAEIINDRCDGLLFNLHRPQELEAAIWDILHDDSLRARVKAGGRNTAARFELSNHIAKVLEVYSELLAASEADS